MVHSCGLVIRALEAEVELFEAIDRHRLPVFTQFVPPLRWGESAEPNRLRAVKHHRGMLVRMILQLLSDNRCCSVGRT